MERREQIKVKSGDQYDYLFPRAMLGTVTKKKGATVADTIRFIPQVVQDTLFHTEKIAALLKRKTLYDTCKAIWHFVYDHIAYKKDEDGKEQIRSPARAWHDRGNNQGVDCDCYTVFISSILSSLKIRHVLRITKYKEDHFQHIYPIVPLADGSYITIDCVVRNFNYEEPYSEKKDTPMDLEYLNGINDSIANKTTDEIDLMGIYDDQEAMSELGKLFQRKATPGAPKKVGLFKQKPPETANAKKGLFKGKLKAVVKQGLHITNRLNPATALLRAGILASAKLNVLKIAQRIKYAYLSDAEAQKRGIDMAKFAQLKKIKEKLETIFYGAGGKPENLKQAILTGKGNKDHDVKGLGYMPEPMAGMNEYTPVSSLLGSAVYEDELSGVISGLGELGVVTATALTSASGVVGAIAGLLKSIGNIFTKKDKASKDFEEGTEGEGTSATEAGEGGAESGGSSDGGEATNKPALKKASAGQEDGASSESAESSGENADGSSGADKSSFWEKNKKWIKPVGIGLGTLGLLYAGYRIVTGSKKPHAKPALSGIPKSKKHKKKGGKKTKLKSRKHKKEAVALL